MKQVEKILYKECKKNVWPLGFLLVLMLLVVGFDVLSPWPFKILIDNVLSPDSADRTSQLGIFHRLFPTPELLGFFAIFVYFASTFSMSLVEYVKSVYTKYVIKNLTGVFAKEAFKSSQTLKIGFFGKQKIGDYIYRLGNDVSAVGELIEEGILPIITSCLYLLITITIMVLIDSKLTLLALTSLPFLVVGLYIFNHRIERSTKHSEFLNSAVFAFIEEVLGHLKVIQAFSQENKKSEEYGRHITTSLHGDVKVYKLDFLLSLIVGIIIAVSYSIVMVYGIRSVFSGTLTTGLLIVFIFYLDNLTLPILSLIYAFTTVRKTYVKIIRMEDFFNPKSLIDYHKGKVKTLASEDIRFDHVSLSLDGKKVLHEVSFTIEAGKTTVIFGGSGSGKTSIVNLIMRFIDKPNGGQIFIGGIPIEDYDIKTLRDGITYVPQEVSLFNDTLRNNIVFGNAHHTWKEIKSASKLAEADGFIGKMPHKYESKVGEGGGFLSGGQRQRIMLARAFLKTEAPIVIFDESFSSLDVKSRQAVLHNTHKFSRGKTTVIVSNIFDVISLADNVVVLNQGKLLYSGPSNRLSRELSLYAMITEHDEKTAEEVV